MKHGVNAGQESVKKSASRAAGNLPKQIKWQSKQTLSIYQKGHSFPSRSQSKGNSCFLSRERMWSFNPKEFPSKLQVQMQVKFPCVCIFFFFEVTEVLPVEMNALATWFHVVLSPFFLSRSLKVQLLSSLSPTGVISHRTNLCFNLHLNAFNILLQSSILKVLDWFRRIISSLWLGHDDRLESSGAIFVFFSWAGPITCKRNDEDRSETAKYPDYSLFNQPGPLLTFNHRQQLQ